MSELKNILYFFYPLILVEGFLNDQIMALEKVFVFSAL